MGKGRAPCCDKNQVKRGPWSPAEDLRLITFIQNHGHDNWRALPKQAGLLRCGKSCRLRWINYLRPDVKRGNFTPDEEDTIIKLHKTWGNKWSKIASRLPGRTDNEIKNVWNTHLKKRLSQSPETTKVMVFDSSGDESKESSPTTSSSSSSSYQTDKEPPNKQQLDQQTSSSISSESSNSNSNLITTPPDIFWPQDPIDSHPMELDMGIEIQLEGDIDFWNMLDLDNIDHLFDSNEVSHGCAQNSEELQNDEWFKYLENELGLDRPPEADTDDTTATTTGETNSADSAQRLLVDDPCIAYFADGFPQQPYT